MVEAKLSNIHEIATVFVFVSLFIGLVPRFFAPQRAADRPDTLALTLCLGGWALGAGFSILRQPHSSLFKIPIEEARMPPDAGESW